MDERSPQTKTYEDNRIATKNRLDKVSPSFCLAKWLQTTLHLHRGFTHSCHHPTPHEIPLKELEQNVSALHNTKRKMVVRQEMMSGIRPKECQYCWNIEDAGGGQLSDRVMKSHDKWAAPFYNDVLENVSNERILPKYLEVSFSKACNFKCSYCAPAFSSRWAQEILQEGPYSTRLTEQAPDQLFSPYEEENNPYIRAFWQWWPELKNSLHTFRITGGEPLLSDNTFKVLDLLSFDPAPDLILSINSNLGVSQARLEQLVFSVKNLITEKKISRFDMFTSLDAWGERAEYIRYGLDTKLFCSNLEFILEHLPEIQITITVTFNALSITSFRQFLEQVLAWRRKYGNEQLTARVFLDITYLRSPQLQAITILPEKYQRMAEELLEFMKENQSFRLKQKWGFYSYEIVKMGNVCQWMQSAQSAEYLHQERGNFYRFFSEHDRRRGTEFLKTFPEMAEFWDLCRRSAE